MLLHTFEDTLRERMNTVREYDHRRTSARSLESARILRRRRSMYSDTARDT